MFKDTVTSREELRAIFGAPMERAVLKERASLDVHSRAFIASAPSSLNIASSASLAQVPGSVVRTECPAPGTTSSCASGICPACRHNVPNPYSLSAMVIQ